HLLDFWERLDGRQRGRLARQIEALDPDLFRKLRAEHAAGPAAGDSPSKWAELAARAEPPPAMRLDGSGVEFTAQSARERGAAALAAGEVGMILVAGGLGTRLGFDQPKGLFPLAPLSKRTLFQILIEQLLAVRRRCGVAIPLYVMTSEATDEVTRSFLGEHANFGLPAADLHIFCQASMWAVDERFERILLEAPDSLFLGPDGHGGMLAALEKSGGLADAERRGIKHLFYGQIDNPLTQICDELFLGSHILAGSEMTTQVVRKREPLERVGNVVQVAGRTQIIEYSDLPEEFARRTNPDGSLKLWAGNLAVHVFDVAFLQRQAADPQALPFHCAKKKVTCLDSQGQLVQPERPNALRFERFIFDLLPRAKKALVVEVDPCEAFAPVKNSDDEPTDNPRLAKLAMMSLDRERLRQAGALVADNVPVEINPLWAGTVEELRGRLARGTIIDQPTYFSPDGPRLIV
ncbi:MAG TPA: UTP--glucose-1-phosphate uridylyltransferase, partial [Pirellulaceae bacterium]|nr:UTP--glucose-1-phosphate uridylyltransferase [Pirellulaceae bacterium]